MSERALLRQKAMNELRENWNQRTKAISEVVDERLAAALAVKDPALARRIAGTRRLQRRIHRAIEIAIEARVPEVAKPTSNAGKATPIDPAILNMGTTIARTPTASKIDTRIEHLLEGDNLSLAVRYAALAIHLRASGGLLSKEEYQEMLEIHGPEGVKFAFANRSIAPDTSVNEDGNALRWGASSIATWAASKKIPGAEKLMPQLVEFDPTPFETPSAHKAAGNLGEKAVNAALGLNQEPPAPTEPASDEEEVAA